LELQVKAHVELVQLAPSLVSLDQANVNGVKQDHMKSIEPLVRTVQQVPLPCLDLQVKTHVSLVQQDLLLNSLDQANASGAKQDLTKPTEPLVWIVQQVLLLCLDLQAKAHVELVQQDLSLVFPVQVNANGVKQDLTKPTEPLVWIVQQVLLLCLDLQTKAHVELVQQDLYLVSLVQASASGVRPDLMKSTEPHVLIVL